MKTRRIISLLLVLALCCSLFAACGKTESTPEPTATTAPTPTTAAEPENTSTPEPTTEPTTEPTPTTAPVDITIGALKGPTSIGLVKLMEQAEQKTAANNYTFQIAGAADELSAAIIKGEIQMAAVPCNLASDLYNKTEGKISMLAINTLGVLYIVEAGNTVNSVADLKGKTIYSTGKGTTPEYTLRYLLTQAGIDPDKDVTIEYKTEATEVAAALAETDSAIAMLPQPYVTTVMMNNDKIRIALNVTEEWEKLAGADSTVVTGVVICLNSLIEEHPEAVAAFLEEYAASTAFATANVEDAANLVEHFGIFKAAVAKKAIPYCNIVCITGSEMKTKATAYLQVLFEQNAKAVGGSMPADSFFYNAK